MRVMFTSRAMNNVAGGVQRMITSIMNEMSARGHEVALFTWDRAETPSFYPMDARVRWYKLAEGDFRHKAGLGLRLRRVPKVRRMVADFAPEVIVGFQGGAYRAMLGYTAGMGIPVIAAERTAPSLYEHASTEGNRRTEMFSFRFAKAIAIQFERYRESYPDYLQGKFVWTPNPVPEAERFAAPGRPGADGRYRLLSVGRLGYQKNFQVLLKAFAQLAEQYPDWDLRIAGEGADRAELEAMIAADPRLVGRVALPGAIKDIASEYAAAQLFCLPARWEGFPNALAEALAHGLPSVGFEECSGVPDLIEAGRSGVLAKGMNDAETLAAALAELMGDAERRTLMGQAATQSMLQYAPERCFDIWEKVLRDAVAR
jgi:glycosyltransferase involved in cell wall biosynthesis